MVVIGRHAVVAEFGGCRHEHHLALFMVIQQAYACLIISGKLIVMNPSIVQCSVSSKVVDCWGGRITEIN